MRIVPLLATAVSAALLFTTAQFGSGTLAPVTPLPSPGCDVFSQQPLFMYQIDGSTIAGPIHFQLTVFSNGFTTVAKKDFFGNSNVDTKNVGATRAADLHKVLVAAGALTICDNPNLFSTFDTPFTTLTMFRAGTTNSAAHTFTYYGNDDGASGVVDGAIVNFVQSEFPNL